jgi:hypothetical protein
LAAYLAVAVCTLQFPVKKVWLIKQLGGEKLPGLHFIY